jgi:hypothetical protein
MEADGAKFVRRLVNTWQYSAMWVMISLWWGIRAVESQTGWFRLIGGTSMLACSIYYALLAIRRFRIVRATENSNSPLRGIEP